jgi:uncharacterized protein (DUF39 family)
MRTLEEINEKIKKGKAVVLTAKEAKELATRESVKEVARKVDVVTTATFGPMCSSGVFLNLGHTSPKMKMQEVYLDGVRAHGGLGAVDIFLGATESSSEKANFGGAHVICKLIRGEKVEVEASGRPSDCYPRDFIRGAITLDEINQAYFFNPRNCYQNYNAATNSSDRILRTYMGVLLPAFGNLSYSGAGEISPLLNDPDLRTIGIGTPVFFCGGIGYVSWEGTQFNRDQQRDAKTATPIGPGVTLAIIADLREVQADLIKPIVIPGYGVSLSVSIGMAIPVFDEEMALRVSVRNRDIRTRIIDFATGEEIGLVNYQELIENNVVIRGKKVRAVTMSRNKEAQRITSILKEWVSSQRFPLCEPIKPLPADGTPKPFPQQ